MGTDIWILTEIQDAEEGWRPLRGETAPRKGPRNYVLFSMLGDSRNRAGRHAPTWKEPSLHMLSVGEPVEVPGFWYDVEDGGHDRLTPIAEPRGVPDDASTLWKEFVDYWHNRSQCVDVTWLTPQEIVDGDWSQPVYSEGILTEEDYIQYQRTGEPPTNWTSDMGGPGVLIVNEIEYAAGKRGENATAVHARWNSGPASENDNDFLELAKSLVGELRDKDSPNLRFMLLFES